MRNLGWCSLLCAGVALLGGGALAQEKMVSPDYTAPLGEARRMLGSGDYAGADKTLRALLVSAPELAEAHFLLGSALLYEQKAAASLIEYTQGAKFREPGPEELLGVALDYIQLKDLADAEHWLLAATKRVPERPLGWYLLGKVQYGEAHAADAERSLLTCLRLDPHHLRAEYTLGLVDEMLKRPEAAAEAYRSAIAWQEAAGVKAPEPYLALGMLLRRQGKSAEALPLLVTAAGGGSREAADAVVHRELALTYEQLGRYDEAADELKKAIALDPQNEGLHFFLGRVDRKSGRRDEAAREFALAADYARRQGDAVVASH